MVSFSLFSCMVAMTAIGMEALGKSGYHGDSNSNGDAISSELPRA